MEQSGCGIGKMPLSYAAVRTRLPGSLEQIFSKENATLSPELEISQEIPAN
jgi:hypothetical protein